MAPLISADSSSPGQHPVVRSKDVLHIEDDRSSKSISFLLDRVATLTLENSDLRTKNAALEQRAKELLEENQHLSLDMHPASDVLQLREDNVRLEEELDIAFRKEKELRVKTGSLYAWNTRLQKEVATLRERLGAVEKRSGSDSDALDMVSGSECVRVEDCSQAVAALAKHAEDAAVSCRGASGTASTGVVVFNPTTPMTPIVGIEGSRYVSLKDERDQIWQEIRSDAYVERKGKEVVVPCRFCVNTSFRPSSAPEKGPILTYIGFTYPDKSSLCYVPVSKVVMQYDKDIGRVSQVSRGDRTCKVIYGRTHVRLGVDKHVFKELVSLGEVEGDTQEENGMILFDAAMKTTCTLEVLKNEKYIKKSVARALKESGRDICGDALLYMRMSMKDEVSRVAYLSFRFHTLREGH